MCNCVTSATPLTTPPASTVAGAEGGGPVEQAPGKAEGKMPDATTGPAESAVAGAEGGGPDAAAITGAASLPGMSGITEVLATLVETINSLIASLSGSGVAGAEGGGPAQKGAPVQQGDVAGAEGGGPTQKGDDCGHVPPFVIDPPEVGGESGGPEQKGKDSEVGGEDGGPVQQGGDTHKNQHGKGHTEHGNGNGYGHHKGDKPGGKPEVGGEAGGPTQKGTDVGGESGEVEQGGPTQKDDTDVAGESGDVEQGDPAQKGDDTDVAGESGDVEQGDPAQKDDDTDVAGESGDVEQGDPAQKDDTDVAGESGDDVGQGAPDKKGEDDSTDVGGETGGPVEQTDGKGGDVDQTDVGGVTGGGVTMTAYDRGAAPEGELNMPNVVKLEAANGDYMRMSGDPRVFASINGFAYSFTMGTGPGQVELSDGTKVSWDTAVDPDHIRAGSHSLSSFSIDSPGTEHDIDHQVEGGDTIVDVMTGLDEAMLQELVLKLQGYYSTAQAPSEENKDGLGKYAVDPTQGDTTQTDTTQADTTAEDTTTDTDVAGDEGPAPMKK